MTDWHRWLAMSGESRATGTWLTGWANVLFLFLVLSGTYLWIPRIWSWRHVRPLIWFRRTEAGMARDFNWHHAIGIWTALPLALVVASAMPISFPWANALVYRIVGEAPRRRHRAPRHLQGRRFPPTMPPAQSPGSTPWTAAPLSAGSCQS